MVGAVVGGVLALLGVGLIIAGATLDGPIVPLPPPQQRKPDTLRQPPALF